MNKHSNLTRNKIFEPINGGGIPKPRKREEGSIHERESSIGNGAGNSNFANSRSFISKTPVNHEKTVSLTSENLSGPRKSSTGAGGLGLFTATAEKQITNKKNIYWFKDNKSNANVSCFRNKKVVISGASSGIGKQIAIE